MGAMILKGDSFSSVFKSECREVYYRTSTYSLRTTSRCGFRILLSQ